ncbi:MAG: EamA/RhaT family transporter, partial [Pseudomonadota bacterium]
MLFLILTVIASSLILVMFRLIDHCHADTRHTISVNYLVAAATGILLFDIDTEVITAPWFWPAALKGIIFYLVFQ